jgi:glutaredoxin
MLVVIVLVVIAGIYYFKNLNKETPEEQTMKCIAGKAIMYSQTACSHCITQKEILGNYTSLFNIIECDKDFKKCSDAEITGTPTWIINGKKVSGSQTIKQLKELTGC